MHKYFRRHFPSLIVPTNAYHVPNGLRFCAPQPHHTLLHCYCLLAGFLPPPSHQRSLHLLLQDLGDNNLSNEVQLPHIWRDSWLCKHVVAEKFGARLSARNIGGHLLGGFFLQNFVKVGFLEFCHQELFKGVDINNFLKFSSCSKMALLSSEYRQLRQELSKGWFVGMLGTSSPWNQPHKTFCPNLGRYRTLVQDNPGPNPPLLTPQKFNMLYVYSNWSSRRELSNDIILCGSCDEKIFRYLLLLAPSRWAPTIKGSLKGLRRCKSSLHAETSI